MIKFFKELWWRFMDRDMCMARIVPVGGLDYAPTQADKPSPGSHFELEELRMIKEHQWPRSEGYWVTGVAGTNSMEPLIDSNSVIVCEDLRGRQGKKWLKLAPLSKGDICVYRPTWTNLPAVLHQIVEIDKVNKLYKFKGINNWGRDLGLVREKDIFLRCFEVSNAQKKVGD